MLMWSNEETSKYFEAILYTESFFVLLFTGSLSTYDGFVEALLMRIFTPFNYMSRALGCA
jgi:hypothetical protein